VLERQIVIDLLVLRLLINLHPSPGADDYDGPDRPRDEEGRRRPGDRQCRDMARHVGHDPSFNRGAQHVEPDCKGWQQRQ
jgi:hypothetical protein